MAALDPALAEARAAGEVHHGLRDVVARVGEDGFAELLVLGLRRVRADEHPVAAALVGALHDQVGDVIQHILPLLLEHGEIGRHVRDDGFLAEVVFDHLRHEVISHLVVRNAGADGVGEVYVTLAIRLDEAGHAEQGVLAEDGGVEEVVVESAVDDVHALETLGGLHEDHVFLHHEILPDDDLDTHGAGEEGMLEVSGVIDAGREEHDCRGLGVRAVLRGDVAEDVEQLLRVVIDRADAVLGEELRIDALHHLAILQHVAHPARAASVVFQHEILAVAVANEVAAADVDIDVLRHVEAHELRAEMFRALDHLARHDALLHDPLLVIEVVQEHIQRGDALHQPALDVLPLGARDDARDGIEGHDPLRALVVAIDGEGDALIEEGLRREAILPLDLRVGQFVETPEHRAAMRAHRAGRAEHLIEKIADLVVAEMIAHKSARPRLCHHQHRLVFVRGAARAELRVEEFARRHILLCHRRRADQPCALELGEAVVQERRAEPAVAVFRQHARTGDEMALRIGLRAQHRGGDDARAVGDDDGRGTLALEGEVHLRLEPVAEDLQRVAPRHLQGESREDQMRHDLLLIAGGIAEDKMRGKCAFERRELRELPCKALPAH